MNEPGKAETQWHAKNASICSCLAHEHISAGVCPSWRTSHSGCARSMDRPDRHAIASPSRSAQLALARMACRPNWRGLVSVPWISVHCAAVCACCSIGEALCFRRPRARLTGAETACALARLPTEPKATYHTSVVESQPSIIVPFLTKALRSAIIRQMFSDTAGILLG